MINEWLPINNAEQEKRKIPEQKTTNIEQIFLFFLVFFRSQNANGEKAA